MTEPIKPMVLPEDWPEDSAHENGCYMNRCCVCSREFRGHKRRATCKLCVTEPIKLPKALRLADALAERRVTQWVHSTGEMPRADGYRVDVECFEAAAELRRLHGEVEELRAIVRGKVVIRKVWADEAGDIQWELVNPEKEPK
jgi:hypothetical protein